ncbi:DUF6734 family protein [Micromonospora sp. NPDC049060]|uniref:DUF6734 family protein n=1 Tax=Micromonospora sp. NPDC049060 TaxID=3154828 RepID=UPI0033CDCCAE
MPSTIPAVHANWVAPRLRSAAAQGWDPAELRRVLLPPEEIITIILSVKAWNRFHGPVSLFADTPTLEFLDARGLLQLYDGYYNAEIDAINHRTFPPEIYFALPKIVGLSLSSAPVAVLDLDLFLRQPLPPMSTSDFLCAHHETLDREIYPLLADLPNPAGVTFPGWHDDLPACNMALALFTRQDHLASFTDLALTYMSGNNEPADVHPVSRITFAEQRLPAYTAARHAVRVRTLADSYWDTSTSEWSDGEPVHLFHHTWHTKKHLSRPASRDKFCIRLVAELLADYPDAVKLLQADPVLARYADLAAAQPHSPTTTGKGLGPAGPGRYDTTGQRQ